MHKARQVSRDKMVQMVWQESQDDVAKMDQQGHADQEEKLVDLVWPDHQVIKVCLDQRDQPDQRVIR